MKCTAPEIAKTYTNDGIDKTIASTVSPVAHIIPNAAAALVTEQRKTIQVRTILRSDHQAKNNPRIPEKPAKRTSVRSPSSSIDTLSTGGPPRCRSASGIPARSITRLKTPGGMFGRKIRTCPFPRTGLSFPEVVGSKETITHV